MGSFQSACCKIFVASPLPPNCHRLVVVIFFSVGFWFSYIQCIIHIPFNIYVAHYSNLLLHVCLILFKIIFLLLINRYHILNIRIACPIPVACISSIMFISTYSSLSFPSLPGSLFLALYLLSFFIFNALTTFLHLHFFFATFSLPFFLRKFFICILSFSTFFVISSFWFLSCHSSRTISYKPLFSFRSPSLSY